MTLNRYHSAEEACLHLAGLLSRMAEKGANVALSGGSTPKLLFHTIAEKYTQTDWSKIRFFWVDERMVPQTDNESNFGVFHRILIASGIVPETSVFPVRYERDEHRSLAAYDQSIREQVPFADGFPQFDLIILGIGEDGHTASIFPDNLSLFDTEDIVALATHPQNGQRRITLTGGVINRAKEVVFLCTGAGKQEILDEVIRKKNLTLPATRVVPAGNLVYCLDEAAAGKL